MQNKIFENQKTTIKQYEERLSRTISHINPNGGFAKTLKVLAKR